MLSIFALIAANVAMELFADTSGDRDGNGCRLRTDATPFAEELQVENPS
jgi:hypothetical protein